MSQKTMKAVQITGKEKVEVREIPVPELFDEKSILIKNDVVCICNLTDTHILEGTHNYNGPVGTTLPFTLGHEICGTVAKVGNLVTDVKVGDRVSVRGWFSSGAFADYTVANADYLKIPDNMTSEDGALLEMLTAVYIMTEQVLRIGDSVVLLGHGGAGTYFMKLLKAGGATNIIVVEPHPEKRAFALKLGATHVIDPYNEDVLQKVKDYTGGLKADVVIDAAGVPDTIKIMTSLVKRKGKIGMFGVCPVPTMGDFYQIHENATAVISAGFNHDYTEYGHQKAMDLVTSGVIDLSDMISHKITLDEVPAALEMIRAGKENIRKIMIKF